VHPLLPLQIYTHKLRLRSSCAWDTSQVSMMVYNSANHQLITAGSTGVCMWTSEPDHKSELLLCGGTGRRVAQVARMTQRTASARRQGWQWQHGMQRARRQWLCAGQRMRCPVLTIAILVRTHSFAPPPQPLLKLPPRTPTGFKAAKMVEAADRPWLDLSGEPVPWCFGRYQGLKLMRRLR